MVQDIDVDQIFLVKDITVLKVKTNWVKPNAVARDQVKIPVDIMKLHKEVFLTCSIFFVKNIPFFLTLSQKIYFTVVNHLTNHTVP